MDKGKKECEDDKCWHEEELVEALRMAYFNSPLFAYGKKMKKKSGTLSGKVKEEMNNKLRKEIS